MRPLRPIGAVLGYLRLLLRQREMVRAMAARELRQRYAGTVVGFLWTVVNPVLVILVYWFVFSVGLRVRPLHDVPFILLFALGFIPWTLLNETVMSSSSVIARNVHLVKKTVFPTEILPVSQVLAGLVGHGVMMAALVALLWAYGFAPTWWFFQLPYYLLGLVVLSAGLGLLVSSLNVFFPDIGQAIAIIMNIWFWLTPIVWDVSGVPPAWRLFFQRLNPMTYIIEGYRSSCLLGTPFWADAEGMAWFWGMALAAFAAGSLVFRKLKPEFAEVLSVGAPAISVRGVSKKFRLFRSPGLRLLEALHPFGKKYHQEFWALRDVSLEVPAGSTLGIVGRNGSGKSTLLQVICGVLRPTAGEVEARGRISALLELGAGFNPEFTGRDNVLLKGSMMGVPRAEMLERLPAIEEFAEIGQFFHHPVKTYSSGMFVRLAFATAINVDPEILIVDEALAVGDARFQHKCFQKFRRFQEEGKTIVFVTHSTDAVVKHCDRAILLEAGSIIEAGAPRDVVNTYLELLFTGKLESYSPAPRLVEAGFRGFNLIQYRKTFCAVAASLGPLDLSKAEPAALARLEAEKALFQAASLTELKRIVEESRPAGAPGPAEAPGEARRAARERFLAEAPAGDACPSRRSYNPGEHRFGDGRARIIDYLVLTPAAADAIHARCGDEVEILVQARFLEPVATPLFGISLKSVEGVAVYGTNTRYARIRLDPAEAGEVIAFRFSLKLEVHQGDYFLDLGVAEMLPEEDRLLDVRYGIVHLVVQHRNRFDGVADLAARQEEVARIAPPALAAAGTARAGGGAADGVREGGR